MANYSFTPSVLSISTGDSVTWTNTTTTFHDTTQSTNYWASPSLGTKGVFTFNFTEPGNYNYECTPHNFLNMTGRVSVAAANVLPAVSLTSPTNGTTLAAPATFTMSATASDNDGFVTNVQFYANNVLLGTKTNTTAANTSFSFTATNLTSGNYTLKAVAKDSVGATNTSSSISISVVTPITTTLSSQTISNGQFRFQYTVNPGLTYVIQGATNLNSSNDFRALVTNIPASSPATYTETASNKFRFYRVVRQ